MSGCLSSEAVGSRDCNSSFCKISHNHGSCPVTHTNLLAHLGSLTAGELKMAASLVTGPSSGSCKTREYLHFSEWEIQEAPPHTSRTSLGFRTT